MVNCCQSPLIWLTVPANYRNEGSVMLLTTEKLYYQDPYMNTFCAKVKEKGTDKNGQDYIILDRTAFYPGGGGQPTDTGIIGSQQVYEVVEEEGEILHYVGETGEVEVGDTLEGKIDWDRRFDHMQQHAGQHVLSAAFEEELGYRTISFHLGLEICTIDLAVNELSESDACIAEEKANRVILQNLPIEAKWVSEEELSSYRLRKPVSVSGNIRLVIIPEFDYNGCGGTHPSATGQIMALKILGWEKQKGVVRLTFVCGKRVICQLHQKNTIIQRMTGLLNAPQESLADSVVRLQNLLKNQEKRMEEISGKLLEHEAEDIVKQARNRNGLLVIDRVYHHRPVSELQKLAKLTASRLEGCLVIFVNEAHRKIQVVCSRGKGMDMHMGSFLKLLLPMINGKGGGNEDFAQGGGEASMPAEEFLERILKLVNVS